MANKHLQHVKSNVVNNGSPKLPTTEQILLGEIGINYAHDYERMSIKNDANEIVEFAPKKYLVGKNEIDNVVSDAIQDALTTDDPTADQEALLKAISDAVSKAIQDALSTIPPTADQEALLKAISDAVSKSIQDALSATPPTADQEALINAISDAVTKALQDALSAIDPTEDQEALIKVIYETLTKAIQETLATDDPTADQEALLKAISDAVAKAIQDALDPLAEDKTIVEQINNIINEYVYENGGTSISLTEVMENSHTHDNMSVLEGITQEKVESWDNASSGGVTNVAYNENTKEITKTVGGQTTTVVNLSTLETDMGLEKGSPNGVAELDANGKVPSSQLPSYVDDVVEGYYYNSKFYKEAAHTTLITGESDKIYVDLSTDTTYRCSNVTNQTYTQIKGDLALGETETTAYRGDRGKIAYDHSQAAHARVDATKTEASSTNGNIKINGVETIVYTHPAFTAQTAAAKKVGMNNQGHVVLGDSLTKSDVGLGNVGNFKAVSTEASQGLSSTEQANARANIGAGTSSFSGNYNDLTNKPTIPTVNDAKFSIKGAGTEVASTTANASTASSVDIVAGSNVTVTPDASNNKITIAATDTTYESKTAASGGTAVSLVTTGEKYTWNNKQDTIAFNSTYNASTNKAATMNDIPSHGTAASGGTAVSVVTTGEMYNWNVAYNEISFLTGSNTESSIESIPVTKRLVICTATSGTFRLASLPPAGREIHVLVTTTSTAASLTIPHGLDTGITYVNTNDGISGSMSVSANNCGEINAISDGTKVYIRYVNA